MSGSCKRCGHASLNEFCYDCQNEFDGLVDELKAGFIADWKVENHIKR